MASDKLRYEHKSIKAVRGTEARSRAKWEKQGWELVDETPGALRTELQFRRPRPPIPWKPLAAMGVIALLCFAVAGVSSLFGSGKEADEPAARAEASQTPTEPVPTAPRPSTSASSTPKPAKPTKPTTSARATARAKARAVTDDEVVAAFQNYIDERAGADVVIAQAVTNVFFVDRVVVVTFDPAEVGMDQQTFDQDNPFNNPYDPSESLADFVSSAVLSNSARDLKLRRAVDGVLAVGPDGKPIGSRDMAEMARLNGLPR